MNELEIMSLIEQRDSLNERVNNLEAENQQLIETNAGIFIEIQELKSLIKEAREIHFNGLEDGSLWVKINANNPLVKQWIEKAEKIKA